MSIKATCRNCGQQAVADEFKLHYKYRMMVCPNCYSGRTEQLQQKQEARQEVKPAGWDAEDEYLEKMTIIRREENQAQFRKIQGTDHVMCKCANCRYDFRYNPYKKLPRTCPYCNTDVPKLRTFNLL